MRTLTQNTAAVCLHRPSQPLDRLSASVEVRPWVKGGELRIQEAYVSIIQAYVPPPSSLSAFPSLSIFHWSLVKLELGPMLPTGPPRSSLIPWILSHSFIFPWDFLSSFLLPFRLSPVVYHIFRAILRRMGRR